MPGPGRLPRLRPEHQPGLRHLGRHLRGGAPGPAPRVRRPAEGRRRLRRYGRDGRLTAENRHRTRCAGELGDKAMITTGRRRAVAVVSGLFLLVAAACDPPPAPPATGESRTLPPG